MLTSILTLKHPHTCSESSADTSRGKGKAPQTMVSDSDPEASDHEPPAAARANGKRTWGGVALQYPSRKRCVWSVLAMWYVRAWRYLLRARDWNGP